MKRKNRWIILSFLVLVATFTISYFNFRVKAASEGVEESVPKTTTTTSSSSTSKATIDTKVTTTTKDITYKDSDGDGIFDVNDPHPNVAEIYVVKDDNWNGIVDVFEILK
jgi:hypothetical protein